MHQKKGKSKAPSFSDVAPVSSKADSEASGPPSEGYCSRNLALLMIVALGMGTVISPDTAGVSILWEPHSQIADPKTQRPVWESH